MNFIKMFIVTSVLIASSYGAYLLGFNQGIVNFGSIVEPALLNCVRLLGGEIHGPKNGD